MFGSDPVFIIWADPDPVFETFSCSIIDTSNNIVLNINYIDFYGGRKKNKMLILLDSNYVGLGSGVFRESDPDPVFSVK